MSSHSTSTELPCSDAASEGVEFDRDDLFRPRREQTGKHSLARPNFEHGSLTEVAQASTIARGAVGLIRKF